MTNSDDKSLDDVKQDAASVGEQAKRGLAQASDSAGDLYGRAKEQVRDLADQVPYSASDAMALGERGSRRIGRRVRKQPVEALLLAGAIGYLVGWATIRS